MENCTQVLEGSFLEDFDLPDRGRQKVGSLSVHGVPHDIFRGENVIGRDDLSDIAITSNAISSKHAVIEVEDWDTHLLYDCGSTNKTRLGKVVLKPNVRYNLQGGDDIMFADLKATYIKLKKPEAVLNNEDSGSETGSESMLNLESVDLAENLAEAEAKQIQTNPSIVTIGFDENQSGDISDTLNHENESSIFEERKEISTTSKVQVVEDSLDDSTDDEDDFFVLPSQTVKEFNSSRQESNIPNKIVNTILTEDIFDPVVSGMQINKVNNDLEVDNSKDIFEMETQEQDFDGVFSKQIIPIQKTFVDTNSQAIFNTEAPASFKLIQNTETDVSIFEAETQGMEINERVNKNEDQTKEQSKKKNSKDDDLFDAETEMPDYESTSGQNKTIEENEIKKEAILKEVKSNKGNTDPDFCRNGVNSKVDELEMSELVLSRVSTELNTSIQTDQRNNKILEEPTVLNTLIKNQHNMNESNDSGKILSKDCKSNAVEIFQIKTNISDDLTEVNTSLLKSIAQDTTENISGALTQVNTSLEGTIRTSINVETKEVDSKEKDRTYCVQTCSFELNQCNEILKDATYTPLKKKESTTSGDAIDFSNALTQVNFVSENTFHTTQKVLLNKEKCTETKKDFNEDDGAYTDNNFANEETQINIQLHDRKRNSENANPVSLVLNRVEKEMGNIEAELTQPNLNLTHLLLEEERSDEKLGDIAEAETQPYFEVKRCNTAEDNDNTNVEDNNKEDQIRVLLTSTNKISGKALSTETNKDIKNDNFGVDDSSNESDSLLATMPLDTDNLGIEQLSPKSKALKDYKRKNKKINGKEMIFCNVNVNKTNSCVKTSQEIVSGNLIKDGQEPTEGKSTLTVADMEICSTVEDRVSYSTSLDCDGQKKSVIKSEVKRTPSQSAHGGNTTLATKNSCKSFGKKMSLIVEEQVIKSKKIYSKNLFGKDPDKLLNNTLDQSIFLNEPCFSSTPFKSEHEKILKDAEYLPSKQDILKTPKKNIQLETQGESPILPSTEELMAVADKTPDFKHDMPPDKKKKNVMPLALKRTPRAKKLSRRMAESLEIENNKLKVDQQKTDENCSSSRKYKKTGDLNKNTELKSLSVRIERNCDSTLETQKSMGIKALQSETTMLSHPTTIIKVLGSEENSLNEENSKVLTTEYNGKQLRSPSKSFSELRSNCTLRGKADEFSLKCSPEKVMPKKVAKKLSSKRLEHISKSPDSGNSLKINAELSIKEPTSDTSSVKTEQGKSCRLDKNREAKLTKGTNLRISKRNTTKQKAVAKELHSSEKVSSKEHELSKGSNQELTLSNVDKGSNDCSLVANSFSVVSSIEIGPNNFMPPSQSDKNNKPETTLPFNGPKISPKKNLKRNQEKSLKEKQQPEENEQQINSKRKSSRSHKAVRHCRKQTSPSSQESNFTEDKSRVSRSTKRGHLTETSPQNTASLAIATNHHNLRKQINSSNVSTSVTQSVQELGEPHRKSRKVTSCFSSSNKKSKTSEDNIEGNHQNKKRQQKGQIITEHDVLCTADITKSDSKSAKQEKNKSEEKLPSTLELKAKAQDKNKSLTSGERTEAPIKKTKRSRKEKSQVDESNQKSKEILTEHEPSIEGLRQTITRNKRKLQDNEKTGPSIKCSRTSSQALKKESKEKLTLEDGSDKASRENEESTDAGYGSGERRARVKPVRYRENENRVLLDSSAIEKCSVLSTKKKALGISHNSEAVGLISSEPKSKKNNSFNEPKFAVPPKSNSRKKDEQSVNEHNVLVPESKGRKKCNTKHSRTSSVESSRSRSGSFSSQSSVRSEHSLTPRRSMKRGEKVLFTALSNQALESDIIKLGGSVVDCPSSCSVLVTDKVRRTVKFLCVLGQGKPIVTPDWIVKSYQCCAFQETSQYLLKDSEAEQKFSFNLRQTLELSRREPLLRGYTVYATPSVKPPPDDIKSIVESCGGVYTVKPPVQWSDQSVIISHPEDKAMWKQLKAKGVIPPIVAAEMLLLGVLQHNLDLATHRIV